MTDDMMPNRSSTTVSVRAEGQRTTAQSRALVDALVLVGALALFALLAAQMTPFLPDDSFITYRYAQNLAAGDGLTFNPGQQPVEGYSNFLWLVLLAGSALLGFGLESASVLWGGLFGLSTVAGLWWLLRFRGRQGWSLAIPVGLLATSGPYVLYAISGMETALFGFLLMAATIATALVFERPSLGRGAVLGIVGVLLALTRPEGLVALPVLALCLVALDNQRLDGTRRPMLWAAGAATAVFAIGFFAYHGARIAYFDALWPTPFLSKGASELLFFDTWATNLRQFFLRQSHYYAPMAYYYIAIAIPAIVVGFLSISRWRTRQIELAALVLALLYAVVYFNFVDWMPGLRYYAPLVGLLLVPVGLLGDELAGDVEAAGNRSANLAFVLLGALLGVAGIWSLATVRMDSQQLQSATSASLVKLGNWLGETMPSGTVLAISDVGAAPFYSGLTTFDINPNSLLDRRIASEGWSDDYFFGVDPDVVVLTGFSLTDPDFPGDHERLYASERFQATYTRIGVTRNDWHEDRSYWVFVRRGAEPTAAQMAAFPAGIKK